MSTIRKHVLFFLILFVFFVLTFASARVESLTFDEIVHLEDTRQILTGQNFRTADPYNPPFALEIIGLVMTGSPERYIASDFASDRAIAYRAVIIAESLLLLVSVYIVGYAVFGTWGATVAAAYLAFDPQILAMSHYIKYDILTALLYFWSFIGLTAVYARPAIRRFVFLGITWGLAAASRILMIPLLLFSFIGVSIYSHRQFVSSVRTKKNLWILSICIMILTLWATFLFQSDVIIAQRHDENRVSYRLRIASQERGLHIIARGLDVLETQPVPLGRYLALVKNTALRKGHTQHVVFLGSVYDTKKWYFFPLNVFLKTPVPQLIAFAASLVLILVKPDFRRKAGIYLIPILIVVGFTSFSDTIPLVRYGLPMYPFIALFVGFMSSYVNKAKRIMLVLLLWQAGIAVFNFPHYLPYSNIFAGTDQYSPLLFSDSNGDWGQGLISLRRFIEKERPSDLMFSYFGRDNAQLYGFPSNLAYGSFKRDEICLFHNVHYPSGRGFELTVISISNWYDCGYFKTYEYGRNKVDGIVAKSFIIFRSDE